MSEIVFNSPQPKLSSLQSQIDSFQTTLASLNQRVYILQETLQERDQEIAELQMRLVQSSSDSSTQGSEIQPRSDHTLTIVGILINLYKFIFPPGKE